MPVPGAVIPITYRFTARLAIRALQPGLLRSRGQKRENPAGLGRLYACHHFSLVFLLAFQYSPHSTPSHPICVFPCCTCMLVHSFSLAAASYLPTYLPTYLQLPIQCPNQQQANKTTTQPHHNLNICLSTVGTRILRKQPKPHVYPPLAHSLPPSSSPPPSTTPPPSG